MNNTERLAKLNQKRYSNQNNKNQQLDNIESGFHEDLSSLLENQQEIDHNYLQDLLNQINNCENNTEQIENGYFKLAKYIESFKVPIDLLIELDKQGLIEKVINILKYNAQNPSSQQIIVSLFSILSQFSFINDSDEYIDKIIDNDGAEILKKYLECNNEQILEKVFETIGNITGSNEQKYRQILLEQGILEIIIQYAQNYLDNLKNSTQNQNQLQNQQEQAKQNQDYSENQIIKNAVWIISNFCFNLKTLDQYKKSDQINVSNYNEDQINTFYQKQRQQFEKENQYLENQAQKALPILVHFLLSQDQSLLSDLTWVLDHIEY
ncbi:Armadillo-type fold [Pseudocohnilembus persalinus]|uniref:Armadillo-type fold n=1 Tax=Pseudocohnilembus persalinus TaxID=266149 RepID=A0A0V0Q9K9_PSEPJ|nr:Armadillo-type fold [Pseudocohnilembus persalinus]|eukprot:KRW98759.1 Armadillo-type fold [Pseudocohnilembus persalinus]